jgi:hypothetical protein
VVVVAISHIADAFGPVAIALVGATISLIITGAIIFLVPEIPNGLKGGLEAVPGVLMTGGAAISSLLQGTYLFFGDMGHVIAGCFVEAILMWNVVLPVGILTGAFTTAGIIFSIFFSMMGIWMATAAEANKDVNPAWAIVWAVAAAVCLGFGIFETSKALISIPTLKGGVELGGTGQWAFGITLLVIDATLIALLLATVGFMLYIIEQGGNE